MHNNRNLDQSSTDVPALSPLEAIEAAFVSLARGIRPVALPAALLADRPTGEAAGRPVPVDQVRARLIHPCCRPETRERVWSEIALRARRDGEPWTTVVVGFPVPGLRRVLARLPRLAHRERAEVEQAALTGLVGELAVVDSADVLLARRLLWAADRAGHRIVCRARTARQDQAPLDEATLDRLVIAPYAAIPSRSARRAKCATSTRCCGRPCRSGSWTGRVPT
ncbi:hypothetical protein ACWGCW_27830 [Streptomyces sp. NPDC054933]